MPKLTSDSGTIASRYKNPFARVLMYLLAILVMVPYEAAKKLSDKAYSGFLGGLRAVFLGFPLGVLGGIAAGHHVGWTLGSPWWLWLPAGLAGFVGVLFYLFPIVYLAILKPAWTLADHIWDFIRDFARRNFEKLTGGYIRLVKRLPFASPAWDRVLARDDRSWFSKLLLGLSYPAVGLGSLYLAWTTFTAVNGVALSVLGLQVAAWAAAGFAGVVVGALALAVLGQLLEYGKLPFVAMASGAAVVYALAPLTAGFVTGSLGLGAAAVYAGHALAFLLYTAYVFPMLNVAVSDGFRWFIETVKPMVEKVYDGEEENYRQLFHSLVNLAVAAGLAVYTFGFAPTLGFPVWATWAATAVVALLSYTLVFRALDMDGGNIIIGLVLSAVAGWMSGAAYASAALIFGIYGAVGTGIVAAVLTFLLLFPLAYIAFRAAARPLLAGWLTRPLVALHKHVYGGFKKLMKELAHAYDYGYRDKTPYRELFLHVSNLGATVAAFYGSLAAAQWLGFASWLTILFVAVSTWLSYVLVGKLILKAGTELIGTAAGLSAGIWLGSLVYGAHQIWWLAGLVGIAGALFAFFLAFPVVYIVVRVIASPVLTGWLRPLLAGIHGWMWRRFAQIWHEFVRVYRAVRDFIAPYWQALARAWLSVWKSIREAWDSIRGKR